MHLWFNGTQIRDKLEKAIALYVATAQRPTVSIKTGAITIFPDNTVGLPTGLVSDWVSEWVATLTVAVAVLDLLCSVCKSSLSFAAPFQRLWTPSDLFLDECELYSHRRFSCDSWLSIRTPCASFRIEVGQMNSKYAVLIIQAACRD